MWASDRGDCQRQPKSDQLSAKPPVDTGSFFSRRRHERGVQLYPCGIATVTPQIFTVASWPVVTSRPEVPQPGTAGRRVRTATSPYPPDLSWWAVKRRQTLISRVHLLVSLTDPHRLAVPTRPGVVRAAPTLTSISRIRLPPASPSRCDDQATKVSHLHSTSDASWRTCFSAQSIPQNTFTALPLSLVAAEPSWGTRRTNGRNLWSDTRSAVHDPSKP